MIFRSKLWDGRKHYLDKMSLRDLVRAYAAYPAIRAYALLAVLSGAVAVYSASPPWPALVAAIAAGLIYAPVWYLLHRFVLHGRFLYRSPRTAAIWKRVHFDHHQDPNDLGVLFGALYTTLPTIVVVTLPLGWLIGGLSGSMAALSAALVVTCFYEFCHCIQHLAYTPKSAFLRRIKKLHLAHHFHNETGNFGITNFACDRLLGTFYPHPREVPRSATVFDLGYNGDEIEKFPWVARMRAPAAKQAGGD